MALYVVCWILVETCFLMVRLYFCWISVRLNLCYMYNVDLPPLFFLFHYVFLTCMVLYQHGVVFPWLHWIVVTVFWLRINSLNSSSILFLCQKCDGYYVLVLNFLPMATFFNFDCHFAELSPSFVNPLFYGIYFGL